MRASRFRPWRLIFAPRYRREAALLNAATVAGERARSAFCDRVRLEVDAPHVREQLYFDPEHDQHWRVIYQEIGFSSRYHYLPVDAGGAKSTKAYYARALKETSNE